MSHKPHHMRAAAAVFAVSAAGSLLVGCSSGAGDAGETVLTFFSWENEKQMAPVIAAFEEENPDIRVEISHAPPVAEYISTLQNRLLAGTAADVFVMGSENKTSLIEGGLIEDLTDEPYMDVVASLNKEVRGADGRTYALSISSWASGLAYNVDALAELGYDEFPTEWDDFVTLLEDLAAQGEMTPFIETWTGMPTTVAASIGASLAASGEAATAPFDGSSSFAEQWAEPLEQWAGLFEDGLLSQDMIGISADQAIEEFAAGRAAITPAGPWSVGTIAEINPDLNWAMAGVPQSDGTAWFTGNASPGWAVNAEAKEPEAAHAFLAFLASPAGVEAFHEATGAMTTTTNFTPDVDPHIEPNLLALQEGRVYLPQASWPRHQDGLNVEAVAQLQMMAQGQITPEEAGAALDAKLEQLGG